MNMNQFNGILRAVLPSMLSFAVARGWLTDAGVASVSDSVITIIAAAVTIASAGWSFHTNKVTK